MNSEEALLFHDRQLECWPEVTERYRNLQLVETRTLMFNGFRFTLQHNPARKASSAAKVDAASIAARPCFLCKSNRPSQQLSAPLLGGRYELLVNPFPIFPYHFTIPATEHVPQNLDRRLDDMLIISRELEGFAVFFNGALSGASAPDHFHFQAVPGRFLPGAISPLPFRTLDCIPADNGMLNVVALDGNLIIIPRKAHRPRCYGDKGIIASPASIDLMGVMVLPRKEDFDKMDEAILSTIIEDVTFSKQA